MIRAASRRELLAAFFALSAGGAARAQSPLAVTPACGAPARPTRPQTAGPFFLPNSPQRSRLASAGGGEGFSAQGHVLTRSCRPVAGALVDWWQADGQGRYDVAGFELRGHVFTDERGRWAFETVLPGLYPGRTRHFHVRVQAPNRPVLTTQLYLPGEPGNARDGLYSPALLMRVARASDGRVGAFDFVLDMA
jgi:protocatechuate 3,4-dioxygenase beta subunit